MVPSTFSRLKAARCLPVVLAALIFAGCGTHTPDQSTAYMQGTAQADSAFYLQQMQQSSDDTRINWQLLAIRALVKEGKTGQAVELFNQLPQELNDSQRREKTLLAVEIKLAQKDFAGAQNLLAKITPADLEQNQQARYWQAKIDASQGRPSIDLLRALIAQEPLLGAKEKQQNIDATWQALSSMTQEQANTLVINADENILQGWLDLQRGIARNFYDDTNLQALVNLCSRRLQKRFETRDIHFLCLYLQYCLLQHHAGITPQFNPLQRRWAESCLEFQVAQEIGRHWQRRALQPVPPDEPLFMALLFSMLR